MGVFDKLFNKNKDTEKNTSTIETINEINPQKTDADTINSFSDKFEYNPLENQVSFNIVQNPQKENAFLLIMQLYKKGINVYDTKSIPENEVILENIESITNDIVLKANNSDMLDLARFCKKISTDINELVNEELLKDNFKLKEISKYFSTLPSSNSKFRDRFKFKETIDGEAFNSKTQNTNHYDKYNHSTEQYEALENGEFLKYELKGPISFRKSLKRIFNDKRDFCNIAEVRENSWNAIEENPPAITDNPLDNKRIVSPEIEEP